MGAGVSPPRICIIRLSHFPGDPRLEREIAALVDAGFIVDMLCSKRGQQRTRESLDGVVVRRMPVRHRRASKLRYLLEYSFFFLLAFVLVSALHLKHRYRLIQVNTLPDFLVFTALVPRLMGAKVLLDMHEVTPELYASKFQLPMDSPQVRLVALAEQLSARFAHSVITVSEPTREVLTCRGTPAGKVHVVMNVADDRIFHPQRALPYGHRSTEDPNFHLVCHGTIVERYGFQTAVRAVAILRDRIPELRLSIVGEGDYLPVLRNLAEDLGVLDRVRFTGYVPYSEIVSYLSGCHVGLVTNLKDCFTDLVLPTKLMEYVAIGKPVISSRTRAIEKYFDQSMVLFFESGQADDLASRIVELYELREKRAQLVRNASQFIDRYHWKVIKEEYVSLVRQMANWSE